MRDLIFLKGLSTNLDSHSLVNGQILFTEDTNELYIDFLSPEDGELIRKPIQDKEVAELLQQHIENLNKVENKSSEDIRNELTYENVINALGYIPSVGEGSSFAAESIIYDNTESGLTGENVQAALDEVVEKNAVNQVKIEYIESELENLSPNSVVNTAIGEGIHLTDSTKGKFAEFGMYGKAKQNITSGKNLIPYPFYETTKTASGITFTDNGDGTITVNGTATSGVEFNFSRGFEITPNTEYILNFTIDDVSQETKFFVVRELDLSENVINSFNVLQNNIAFITNSKTEKLDIRFWCHSGIIVNNLVIKPMLRLASITDNTWEPYTGGIPSPNPEYPQDIEVSGESYNLLENTATSQTVNSVVFTVNEDKSISITGKATEWTDYKVNSSFILKKGEYIASCGGAHQNPSFRIIRRSDLKELYTSKSGNIGSFGLEEDAEIFAQISVSNTAEQPNCTFYPMIRKASVKNNRYMPYGKGSVEVKSCGKNLLPYPYYEKTKTHYGVTFTDNGDGSITVNGTATGGTAIYYMRATASGNFGLVSGKEYVINGCPKGGGRSTYKFDILNINGMGNASDFGEGASFVYDTENNEVGQVRIVVYEGQTVNNLVFKPMIRLASDTDSTYEPYKSKTATIPTENGLAGIPVESGGNYTDKNGQQWICDEIVKYADGSGEYIKRVNNLTLNGTEEWALHGTTTGDNLLRFALELKVLDIAQPLKDATGCCISTHFIRKKGNAGEWGTFYSNDTWLVIHDNSREIESIDNFKNFLVECLAEGNPVIVFYAINPIHIPLTAEELAEIEKLSTFYPVTNMSNDFDCGMQVTYFKNSLDGEFISNMYEMQSMTQAAITEAIGDIGSILDEINMVEV